MTDSEPESLISDMGRGGSWLEEVTERRETGLRPELRATSEIDI